MREYRVERIKAPVTLKLRDGLELSGSLFVRPEPRDEPLVRKVQQLLNGPESFLPLEVSAEHVTVVHSKERVLWCRYDGPVGPVLEFLLPRRRVTLLLEDGSTLNGDLVADGPPDRRRVLDCLNLGEPFLLLECGERDYLVRRQAIVLVPSAEQGEPRAEAEAFEVESPTAVG
jgi:hypothetical protein